MSFFIAANLTLKPLFYRGLLLFVSLKKATGLEVILAPNYAVML